jgi:hypothetical protein
MAHLRSLPEAGAVNISQEDPLAASLEAICQSKAFENSATLKNLLRYLFVHRHEQLSEYMLAVEALGRRPDFDPQVDATVRVQISRLRRRLKEYYLAEGRAAEAQFCVPLGTHQLVVVGPAADGERITPGSTDLPLTGTVPLRDPATLPVHALVKAQPELLPASFEPRAQEHQRPSPILLVLAAMVLVLGVACGWQSWLLHGRRLANTQASAELLPFWQQFCANGKPVEIVIPNPTFFGWGMSNGGLMARDTSVNSFMELHASPMLAALEKQYGEPQLDQHYAVSSDVLASLRLMHYMVERSLKVDMTISSNASADLFEGENVILVGTPGTLTPFKSKMDGLYFKFDPQGFTIQNPRPKTGEPATYTHIDESDSRHIYPALVVVMPGISKDSKLLILAGQRTSAVVSFLTSTAGNEQLEAACKKAGCGDQFEAVILTEIDGNTVLSSRIAAVRPYAGSGTTH